MQPPTPDTIMPKLLRPLISRADLRQIGRLAKLRNKCNANTKLHPETTNNHALNPIHIDNKITKILNPTTPISKSEAHNQCFKAIVGTIVRKS